MDTFLGTERQAVSPVPGLVMSRFGKCFALFLVSFLFGFEILGDE